MIRSAYRTLVPRPLRGRIAQYRRTVSSPSVSLRLACDSTVRNRRARLENLRNTYRGRSCFLMGNGPSLNRMDLDRFAGQHVWGSNRCYLLFDRIEWRPSFYVSIDRRVTPDIAEEIDRWVATLARTTFFFPLRFRRQEILRSAPSVYWYDDAQPEPARGPEFTFSTDAVERVYSAPTVTLAQMQLAVFLGFNPIYLIGCDTSYVVPKTVVRDPTDGAKLTSTADDDPNHFDPRYFGTGAAWHDPKPERMIEGYQRAKMVCDRIGVRIYNATVGGQLEVFERIDYRRALEESVL